MKNFFKLTYFILREFKHSLFLSLFGIKCSCKHNPSCSQKMVIEIKNNGIIKGLVNGIKRIISCYGVSPN